MLKRFSVENFKSFKDKITLDFSNPGNYGFGLECVSEKTITKGAIYGKSGIGKSNLGRAIFDIVNNLTDKVKELQKYAPFLNLDSVKPFASFEYEFQFLNHVLLYKYTKKDTNVLLQETLLIDGKEMIFYDFRDRVGFSNFAGSESLNISSESTVSRVKYIMNSAVLNDDNELNKVLKLFKNFVERMLLFYSLRENGFIGFKESPGHIDKIIIESEKVADFENFLNKAGFDLKLLVVDTPEGKTLYLKYQNGIVNFFQAASSGILSLTLFYSWLISIEKCSFVYIDEFDAFYHHELSELIITELKKFKGVQIFVSTHNTDLLSNKIFRPDCYYVLFKDKIDSLNNLVEKDLRAANNLQKIFKKFELEN